VIYLSSDPVSSDRDLNLELSIFVSELRSSEAKPHSKL
jgi:hypothetical protein